jgi:hypothetical protein
LILRKPRLRNLVRKEVDLVIDEKSVFRIQRGGLGRIKVVTNIQLACLEVRLGAFTESLRARASTEADRLAVDIDRAHRPAELGHADGAAVVQGDGAVAVLDARVQGVGRLE